MTFTQNLLLLVFVLALVVYESSVRTISEMGGVFVRREKIPLEYEATDNCGIVQYDYFDAPKHSSPFQGVVFAFDDCRTVSNGL